MFGRLEWLRPTDHQAVRCWPPVYVSSLLSARLRLSGDCPLHAQAAGGSISPVERHAHLLDLIEQQPDLTLDEVVLAMHKHLIPGNRTAVWCFFQRHKITFKKRMVRPVRKWFSTPWYNQSASTYPVSCRGLIPGTCISE